MERIFTILGALSACVSVALGAYAAHGLKSHVSAEMAAVFEIGVRYQMYHALGLLAGAWAHSRWPSRMIVAGGWLFVTGTVLFSGSLYLMSTTGVSLGLVTPLGGLTLMAGWACLALGAWKG